MLRSLVFKIGGKSDAAFLRNGFYRVDGKGLLPVFVNSVVDDCGYIIKQPVFYRVKPDVDSVLQELR